LDQVECRGRVQHVQRERERERERVDFPVCNII
jgi:hypothetical protein